MNTDNTGGDAAFPNGSPDDDPTIPGFQYRADPDAERAAAAASRYSAVDRNDPIEPERWRIDDEVTALVPQVVDGGDGLADGESDTDAVLAEDEMPEELVEQEASAPPPRSRRLPLIIGAVVVVVGIVAAAVIIVATQQEKSESGAEPAAAIPSTTAQESPSASSEASTALPTDAPVFDFLPRTVAGYTAVSAEKIEDMTKAGAVEAYEAVYSNGTDDVTVIAGRWDTPEKALEWATATSSTFSPETLAESGEVDVDDSGAGQFWQFTTASGQEIIWTKGTQAMAFIGPNGVTQSLYSEFPF